jgi:hypothetical protein
MLWKDVVHVEFSSSSKSLRLTDVKQKIGVGYSMIVDDMKSKLAPLVIGSLDKVQSFYKRMGLS